MYPTPPNDINDAIQNGVSMMSKRPIEMMIMGRIPARDRPEPGGRVSRQDREAIKVSSSVRRPFRALVLGFVVSKWRAMNMRRGFTRDFSSMPRV